MRQLKTLEAREIMKAREKKLKGMRGNYGWNTAHVVSTLLGKVPLTETEAFCLVEFPEFWNGKAHRPEFPLHPPGDLKDAIADMNWRVKMREELSVFVQAENLAAWDREAAQ